MAWSSSPAIYMVGISLANFSTSLQFSSAKSCASSTTNTSNGGVLPFSINTSIISAKECISGSVSFLNISHASAIAISIVGFTPSLSFKGVCNRSSSTVLQFIFAFSIILKYGSSCSEAIEPLLVIR